MDEPIAPKPRRTAAQRRAVATARKARERNQQREAGMKTLSTTVKAVTADQLKHAANKRGCTQGQVVDHAVVALDAAQRRAAFRAQVASEGRRVVTIPLKADVARAIETLAREHQRSAADVIGLGILAAKRELDAMAARNKAGGQ